MGVGWAGVRGLEIHTFAVEFPIAVAGGVEARFGWGCGGIEAGGQRLGGWGRGLFGIVHGAAYSSTAAVGQHLHPRRDAVMSLRYAEKTAC